MYFSFEVLNIFSSPFKLMDSKPRKPHFETRFENACSLPHSECLKDISIDNLEPFVLRKPTQLGVGDWGKGEKLFHFLRAQLMAKTGIPRLLGKLIPGKENQIRCSGKS